MRLVVNRGIEANTEKITTILEMKSPAMTKDVQRLIGSVAVLNRFISRVTDKCLPFFKVLRKEVKWTPESEKCIQELKAYLASPQLHSGTV